MQQHCADSHWPCRLVHSSTTEGSAILFLCRLVERIRPRCAKIICIVPPHSRRLRPPLGCCERISFSFAMSNRYESTFESPCFCGLETANCLREGCSSLSSDFSGSVQFTVVSSLVQAVDEMAISFMNINLERLTSGGLWYSCSVIVSPGDSRTRGALWRRSVQRMQFHESHSRALTNYTSLQRPLVPCG